MVNPAEAEVQSKTSERQMVPELLVSPEGVLPQLEMEKAFVR